jgi:hypothetical protein
VKLWKYAAILGVGIAGLLAYAVVTGFREGQQRAQRLNAYGKQTAAENEKQVQITQQWVRAVKTGQSRDPRNYFTGELFRTVTDETATKLQTYLQSLPPPSTVPPEYSALDAELRQHSEADIRDFEAMSSASKAGRVDVVAATMKSFDGRIAQHNTRMDTNAGKQPGWGK